jgi:hypothetical protein
VLSVASPDPSAFTTERVQVFSPPSTQYARCAPSGDHAQPVRYAPFATGADAPVAVWIRL